MLQPDNGAAAAGTAEDDLGASASAPPVPQPEVKPTEERRQSGPTRQSEGLKGKKEDKRDSAQDFEN